MSKDNGVRAGCQPSASAPDGSSLSGIPDAGWFGQTIATWETWRYGDYVIAKTQFDGPWTLTFKGQRIGTYRMLQGAMEVASDHAQAMSASGQDRNGLEAKPASAVAESHAPKPDLTRQWIPPIPQEPTP